MSESSAKNYFDPKVLARISRMDLKARMIVEGFISGMHRSPYHGYSVEFAEYREYVPGDDIKHIDWKVWGRQDRFYLKQYEEETNLRCHIMLDCSKSMLYGSESDWSKFDYGATLAASLAVLLQKQQDAAGLVLFDNKIKSELPPKTHPRHLNQILHELGQCTPSEKTDVDKVFTQLPERINKRGIVVLISDLFMDLKTLDTMLQKFRHKGHEIILFHLLHEDERSFPFSDNTLFRGLEEEMEIMTDAPALRKAYLEALESFIKDVRRTCTRYGGDFISLSTSEHLDAALSAYLGSRSNRPGGR